MGTGSIAISTQLDDNGVGDEQTQLGYNNGTSSNPVFNHYLRGRGITNIDTLGGCNIREGLRVGKQVQPGDYSNFDNRYLRFGLGETNLPVATNDDLRAKRFPTSFYRMGGGAGRDMWGGWGAGILLRYDANNAFHLWVSASRNELQFQMQVGSSIRGGALWGKTNTTVVDGYIKTASPIIEIHPDGKFTTNDESEGAIVERLSEGVYLIKNVLGFNADAAWGGVDGGVEIPLCKNKLPLIWVDYKVLPDGSIKIMTYHREHPNAPTFAQNVRDGYSDGDPIDIPAGRSISVRVQMPESSIWNQQQRKLTESE
ncbi:hypothetical protein BDE27_3299 [Xenorhabdus ehlersii]|uniref:Phage tail protein C-terminal domain-containing protein n=2 Tax=Xenorhabdus ehlersii TaxID=290111 RepID=A0ABX9PGG4_9GAMM|nr:hypothetical protein BDE27_3299 [Xenorhabdus ehlersii]